MIEYSKHYIDGKWVAPVQGNGAADVIDPATEQVCAKVVRGSAADLDLAVSAAQRAFESFSQSSLEERKALLDRIIEVYKVRMGDMADRIRLEMGAPGWLVFRACPSDRSAPRNGPLCRMRFSARSSR